MSLAAAASASAFSSSARFLSPSTAARRRFLHHLLAAPPRPPQLRRCSPYHWMAQFWTEGSLEKNNALVEYLKQYGVVRTDKVAEVMETIDRALFVPEGFTPYIDSPMPIGYNATISAPHMHATCLELLKDHLQPGMHALDVGSGSGYLTACFAMMVGPEGRAVGIEHIPELVAASTENVERSAAAALLKDGSLSFHVSGKVLEVSALHSEWAVGADSSMEDPMRWATIKASAEVHPPPRSAPWRATVDSLAMILPRDATAEDRRQFLLSKGFLVE